MPGLWSGCDWLAVAIYVYSIYRVAFFIAVAFFLAHTVVTRRGALFFVCVPVLYRYVYSDELLVRRWTTI